MLPLKGIVFIVVIQYALLINMAHNSQLANVGDHVAVFYLR